MGDQPGGHAVSGDVFLFEMVQTGPKGSKMVKNI